MNVLTVTTHLVAFLAGGLTVRLLTLHFVRAVDLDGHPALEFTGGETMHVSPRARIGWVVLVASLVLVGIGVQGLLAARDNAERDRHDRAYAACLTRFATDLVATIERRTEAADQLARAKARRDAATDRVIRAVTLARRNPPEASEADFEAALEEQLAAQRHYREVLRETAEVRAAHQYVAPDAVCDRP